MSELPEEKLPDRKKVDKQLRMSDDFNANESYLSMILSEIPDEPVNVQQFTNLDSYYKSDGHALIAGRTGKGKTTLQTTMSKSFIDSGWKVLRREPANDFCYLAGYVGGCNTQIFIPQQDDCTLELFGFDAEVVATNDPNEVIKRVYEGGYQFNVMLYDNYTYDLDSISGFYAKLFLQLMHKCQQTRKAELQPLLFEIDELNDLAMPRGKGATEVQTNLARTFEYAIRKLRKYKVRILGTSQRFNQISIDVRSQFEHTFIKKNYGYDIWAFFAQQLITSNNKTFWKVLKHVISMPVNEFLFFDENAHFDFYTYPDIPRDNKLDVEMLGTWKGMPKRDGGKILSKTADRYNAIIVVELQHPGLNAVEKIHLIKQKFGIDVGHADFLQAKKHLLAKGFIQRKNA